MESIDIGILFLIIIILYLINNTYPSRRKIIHKKNKIRPAFNDEFWNYNEGTGHKRNNIINDKYNLYEFITNVNHDETIINTHSTCPVMEGNQTKITSCIHFPNRIPDGSTESISSGFLVHSFMICLGEPADITVTAEVPLGMARSSARESHSVCSSSSAMQ